MTHLKQLEQESIHVIREVVAEFKNPVMLYSVGKDSAVMVRLAQKAFHPGKFPFPLMHIDTGYKFPEMYEFRDKFVDEIGARLIVERNEEWIAKGAHPCEPGQRQVLPAAEDPRPAGRTWPSIDFDAAFGGARRDEEKSRAKERFFSVRDEFGQWDPKNQRPELWNLYNAEHRRRRERARLPPEQLDRAGRLAVHQARRDPHRARCTSSAAQDRRAERHHHSVRAHGHGGPHRQARASLRTTSRRCALPLPQPGLHPLHRRGAVGGRAPSTTSSPR